MGGAEPRPGDPDHHKSQHCYQQTAIHYWEYAGCVIKKFNQQLATITVATIATFTYRTAVAAKILWHTLHLFYFKLKIREAL